MRNLRIFTGSSHPELTERIVDRLGQAIAPALSKKFPNREMALELSVSVRNKDVFLVQSGSAHINDHLMELLILINACKSASARRITAVLPYFPYTKQSKKKGRVSIAAKLVANMLAVAGVDHVITMDLHSSQMQGFFNRPVDNLLAEPSIARYIQVHVADFANGVVVSKNAGGVKRVTSLADRLKIDFALIHRERHHDRRLGGAEGQDDHKSPEGTNAPAADSNDGPSALMAAHSLFDSLVEGGAATRFPADADGAAAERSRAISTAASLYDSPSMGRRALVGPGRGGALFDATTDDEDEPSGADGLGELRLTLVGNVRNKPCFLLDDIVDDPHAYMDAARHLKICEAGDIYLIATHGILSGDSLAQLEACDAIHRIIVTNTYPIPAHKLKQNRGKLCVIDISGVLAEAIRRTHNGESISYLFHTAIL